MSGPMRWTVLWRTGEGERIQWYECRPILFQTRRECKDFIYADEIAAAIERLDLVETEE